MKKKSSSDRYFAPNFLRNLKAIACLSIVISIAVISFAGCRDGAERSFNRGERLMAEGDTARAAEAFRRAVKIHPGFTQAYLRLGEACDNLGLIDEAEEAFKTVIELDPEYLSVYLTLMNFYDKHGRFQDAIQINDRANRLLSDNPDDYADMSRAEAYNMVGQVHSSRNEFDKAMEAFNRAVDLQPDLTDAYFNIGFLYIQQELYDDAIASLLKILEIEPRNTNAMIIAGSLYAVQKNYPLAIQAFKDVLTIDPDNETAADNLRQVIADMEE